MKKIFTHLFAVLLLSFVTTGAWAQITFTVDPSKGSYSGTGTYCTGWTSNSEDYPETKISVSVNNMATSPASSSSFEIATGQTSPSTWYLMVDGCRILSYSFKCKLKDSTSSITVTAGDNSYVMTTEEQTVEVSGLDNVQKASFQLSGDNKHLVVTELTFTASPILEEGCVYMFKNARADRSLRADGADDVHTKATDANDTAQQWYVTKEDGYYILRNVAYGKYLKGASSSGTGWSLTDDYSAAENKFELHISNSTLNTLKTKDSDSYGYMHDDTNEDNGGCNVVGWLNGDGNTGSHWTITKVDYTAEQITALLEKAPTVAEIAGYTTALGELFTDVACVTPKLESLAEAQASNAYKALPTGLKAMVDKVYNEKTEGVETAWYEDNANAVKEGWSGKYAKKFRVQMYEPYSIAGDITSWLGINAHANNDNPTGIYVPEAGTLYVMVEGTINDGASLRIVDGGHNGRVTNATGGGYALKPGLNVINYTAAAGHLYICYNVDTYNPDGTTDGERFPHKLSDYEPLKIHIEGGAINGFYNAQGDFRASAPGAVDDLWYTISGASVDCDADWEYMEVRANLNVLPVLGHRQILLFQLNDEDTEGNKGMKTLLPETVVVPDKPYTRTEKWSDLGVGISDAAPEDYQVNVMMESWDRIMYSELATMGVLSKEDVNKMNNLYPRWTSEKEFKEIYDLTNASTLDNKTYLDFCNGVDYSEYFNHHGVALGVGGDTYMYGGWDHCGYHHNTLGSIVSKLSSEAGPTWGPGHEIGHQHQGIFNLNGQTEVTNNLFANIAVWYMGMGTSRYNGSDGNLEHVLGAFNTENNDAYTNNIWALTHMYYRLWLYYHMAGNNTQFMPRLFELCRRERLQNGTVISGDQSMLLFYKHACDAAGEDLTEFFRAHGYLEVMEDRLVGDYTSAVYTQTQEMVDEAIAYVKNKWSKQNYAIILINDGTSETTLQHNGTASRALWDSNPSAELGSVTDFIDGEVSVGDYTATYNSDGSVTMTGEGGVGFLVFNEDGELVSFSNKTTFALSDEAMETIMTGNATFVTVDSEGNTVEAEVDLATMQKDILGTLIAKAQKYVDLIDDTYTKIGYYKGAALAGLKAALESAQTVYAGSSGYEAAYDLLYAELKKVEANGDAKIPFNSSLTYIITNKAYPGETMWVNADSTVRSESGVDASLNSAKWQFKETGVQGVYNIYNMSGLYCPAVKTSTAMKAVNTEQPDTLDALYTLQEMEDGVWAIKLSPAAGYRNFHSSWNNVVGWETGNDASRWYLTAVEAEPTIADLTNLEVYINKTEALLGEVLGTVTYTRDENITLQTTDEDQPFYIWSNAPCPTEGPIANLVDGATDNYFHTAWEDVTVSSGDHYIAVDLGEDADLSRFAFSHTTRSADNDHVKSVDVYGSDDNVTYKYLGSASGMPQTRDTFWQYEGVMIASHRYLRFNMHASRGYWHMAEFDIMPVTGFTATVNDTYSGTVTVDAVTAAMEALLNGKSVAFSMSPTKETIDPVLEVLKTAYKALYTEYEATITARKNTLAQLVTETNELIDQVGTVQLFEVTPVELKESNFYCNAPYIATQNADYSAGYVSKLTDGNNSTYLHTRWNANSDDGDFHYLRVDAGDTPIDLFQFTYTTAKRTKKDMPLTMVVEGANEIDGVVTTKDESFTQIAELTPLPEVLNANTVYNSEVLGSAGTKYRYLRFKVTEITVEESDGNGHPFFTMAEFGISSVVEEKVTVNESYKSNVSDNLLLSSVLVTNSSDSVSKNPLVTSVPLLDAQIADQQAAKDKLYAAMNNTAALKENLKKLIDDTQALYDKMATDEGAVNEYYSTSSLTAANLSEALTEIEDALVVYDNSSATVDDINTAFDELNTKYGVLNGIEELNVADRGELKTLIDKMEDLLEQTTVSGAVETGNLALQIDDEAAPYYIWSNAPASDCNSYSNKVQGLIDVNTDGSANTGTFFGTVWLSSSEAYSHYVEIDLGVNTVIEDFAIDYTTRYSGAADSRPTGLKFYGSNDKKIYTELFSVTEGLPTTENTKWEMSAPHELAKNYRYIRVAVASNRGGCFNMSDFNLYSHCIATVKEFYSTSEIFDCLPAAMREYCDAKEAVGKYLIADDCTAAKEQLQAQIDALQAIINGNVTVRSELEGLADDTEVLVTEDIATFDETETVLTMQCTDVNAPYYLYCNADGTTHTTYPNDANGVKALLDTDTDNHLHTTYEGEEDDDLDHYLRLDMGKNEAMMSFKFSYTGRVDGNGNAPKTMVIEGSNDLDTFDVIATLTDLPTTDTKVTYTTPSALGNGKAYRYIRFMVTETKNNDKHDGHPYFVLSQFSVTACKTIEVKEDYALNLPLATLVTANNEVVDANAVVDCETYVTQNTYNTALAELQAAYNALNLAKNLSSLPVKLTTDVNNPVLYKIKIKRNENVFTYKGETADASKKPVLAAESLGNRYQAWYFMQGTNADSYGDVLIMPYYNEGTQNTTLRLSYADNNDGTEPVVVASETNTTDNWYITFTEGSTTEGWWNLQPEGGMDAEVNAFVNQYGGTNSTKLAFWRNANNPSDPGSQFQFVLDETDYSLSDAYYALYNQHASYPDIEAGTEVGAYTQATVDVFNTEFDEAKTLLEAKNSTDDEYNTAREQLVAAYEALEINMPDPAKYYVLRCNHEDRYIYVNADNKLQWAASSYDKAQSRAVWQFEDIDASVGTCKMKSLHTMSYLNQLVDDQWTFDEETGKVVTIVKSPTIDGAVIFKIEGHANEGLHAHGTNNRVIAHSNEAVANHYFFEEIEDVTSIKHDVTMKTKFSSVTLGYNATVPAGVEAYNAVGLNDGYVSLVKVEGEVIPANTPVILYRTDGDSEAKTFTFTYTDATAEKPASTLLGGSLYTKYVQCDDSDYYKLMIKNGEAKMYLMYKEFDAEGNSQGATHAGGHIKCSANKIYMRVPAAQGVASYGMRFVDYGTTDIDDAKGENQDAETIYDLQGRKLSEITEPGFYIVDGKKVYVK